MPHLINFTRNNSILDGCWEFFHFLFIRKENEPKETYPGYAPYRVRSLQSNFRGRENRLLPDRRSIGRPAQLRPKIRLPLTAAQGAPRTELRSKVRTIFLAMH
ncbi:hypothetical protein FHS30_002550 [Simiduia aestuariiviva]|uniref:Uncharacterized protein n=1 Tax=Simiduia aestuariiviva TaxID=1510459 RepID=A0A839UNC5_9GAMM|nr:hypothetical protein [Simiduia aestuariiviva]